MIKQSKFLLREEEPFATSYFKRSSLFVGQFLVKRGGLAVAPTPAMMGSSDHILSKL